MWQYGKSGLVSLWRDKVQDQCSWEGFLQKSWKSVGEDKGPIKAVLLNWFTSLTTYQTKKPLASAKAITYEPSSFQNEVPLLPDLGFNPSSPSPDTYVQVNALTFGVHHINIVPKNITIKFNTVTKYSNHPHCYDQQMPDPLWICRQLCFTSILSNSSQAPQARLRHRHHDYEKQLIAVIH